MSKCTPPDFVSGPYLCCDVGSKLLNSLETVFRSHAAHNGGSLTYPQIVDVLNSCRNSKETFSVYSAAYQKCSTTSKQTVLPAHNVQSVAASYLYFVLAPRLSKLPIGIFSLNEPKLEKRWLTAVCEATAHFLLSLDQKLFDDLFDKFQSDCLALGARFKESHFFSTALKQMNNHAVLASAELNRTALLAQVNKAIGKTFAKAEVRRLVLTSEDLDLVLNSLSGSKASAS